MPKKTKGELASVRCSDAVKQRAKVYAAKARMTIQAVVDAALTEYLNGKRSS
jgi:ribosomal protein S26